MSKRAEELVDGILDLIVYRPGHPDKPMALKDRMRGLVDSELRKERDRCADRFAIKWKGADEQGEYYRSAILSEDDK
jgi:hypothetical protein